jgi:hypothetical protein
VAAGELVQRGVRARAREAHLDEQLAGSSAVVKKPRKNSRAGSRARRRAAATIVASSSTASMHHSPTGSAWATEPPNVPARADRVVADPARGAREDLVAADDVGVAELLDRPVLVSAPIRSVSPSRAHVVEVGDARDVDERRRPREAEVHHRHEALAAGEHLGVLAQLARRSSASSSASTR